MLTEDHYLSPLLQESISKPTVWGESAKLWGECGRIWKTLSHVWLTFALVFLLFSLHVVFSHILAGA